MSAAAAAVANMYEQLLVLGDCRLTLDRRKKEVLLSWVGKKDSHLDAPTAAGIAQAFIRAAHSEHVGLIATMPCSKADYSRKVWADEEGKIWTQVDGPYPGPAYSFDCHEALRVAEALISGVRALEGWR